MLTPLLSFLSFLSPRYRVHARSPHANFVLPFWSDALKLYLPRFVWVQWLSDIGQWWGNGKCKTICHNSRHFTLVSMAYCTFLSQLVTLLNVRFSKYLVVIVCPFKKPLLIVKLFLRIQFSCTGLWKEAVDSEVSLSQAKNYERTNKRALFDWHSSLKVPATWQKALWGYRLSHIFDIFSGSW